jgi:hypothetical protein
MQQLMDSSAKRPEPGSQRLAGVFDWGTPDDRLWEPAEFRAIVEHLLQSPMQFDLAGLEPGVSGKLARLTESQGLLLKSFGDLLRHPLPPLELLELTKEWAKANRECPESSLPPEVVSVLYYACIAAALARLGKRITKLSDAQLQTGFAWSASQPWAGDELNQLFSEVQTKVASRPVK